MDMGVITVVSDADRRKRQLRKLKQAPPCPECGRRESAADLVNPKQYWDALSLGVRQYAVAEGPETLIVSTADRKGGRSAFIKGSVNVTVLEKVLATAGSPQPAGTMVHVGAGIGGLAIAAVNRGLFTQSVAIEPVPDLFRLLQANIILNGVDGRVTSINAALAPSSTTSLSLAPWGKNPTDQRVVAAEDPKGESLSPTVSTVQEAVPDLGRDDLLVLDVAGYEGKVLAGSAAAIAAGVPVVFTFSPLLTARYDGFDGIQSLLAHHGGWYDLSAAEPLRQSGGLLSDMYRDAVAAQASASVTILVTAD
jgi:FkbM family methyltransferase